MKSCLLGLVKKSAKNRADLLTPQTTHILAPPLRCLKQCTRRHRRVYSKFVTLNCLLLSVVEGLIFGDVQQYDGADSSVQPACLIARNFKLTYFPPITVFVTRSLLMTT